MKIYINLFILLLYCSSSYSSSDLGEWLNINEPLVKKYLIQVNKSNNHKPLKGVTLSDGDVLLKDWLFVKRVNSLSKGTFIYLFKNNETYKAYIWLTKGEPPITLNGCDPKSEKAKFPWLSGAAISGDVYTNTVVDHDSGIVVTECPNIEWLK